MPRLLKVGNAPWGVCFDGTNIWIANEGSNSVSKITPMEPSDHTGPL